MRPVRSKIIKGNVCEQEARCHERDAARVIQVVSQYCHAGWYGNSHRELMRRVSGVGKILQKLSINSAACCMLKWPRG